MKRTLRMTALAVLYLFVARPSFAQFGSILGTIKRTVEEKVDEKAQEKTSEAMDTVLGNNGDANANSNTDGHSASSTSSNTSQSGAVVDASSTPAQKYSAYQNYDFKPGENIIFEDEFTEDQDGEFASHWDLDNGQAVVNNVSGQPAFLLTDGNYATVHPRMTNESYLTEPFTVEFDYYQADNGQNPPLIRFRDADNNDHEVHFGREVSTSYFPKDLSGGYVEQDKDYFGKWHHGAIIFRNGQMKAYLDNHRALVMPRTGVAVTHLAFAGIGNDQEPVTFRNVRIAEGGSDNTIGSLLTKGKFVTHGITFDVGKATLKPESMGVLNDVAKYLQSNAATHFEIDGYTDSDGATDANVKLSQDRADAVRSQLVAMGIAPDRLTTKGFGAANPLGPNDSPEHKAMNRRVEFVKK